MRTVQIHRKFIYDIEEEWLETFDEGIDNFTPSIFWKYVKETTGLEGWEYNSRSEYFTCEVRDEKKATMFLLRFT